MRKRFLSAVVSAAAVLTAAAAAAAPAAKTIEAVYNNIKLVVNSREVIPKDVNGKTVEPFIADGTAYLPVRAVAETLGAEVDWDEKTNTVLIDSQEKRKDEISFQYGDLLYENPLAGEQDVKNFVMEGDAAASFPNGRLRLENNLDPSLGQASNYVFWCDKKFPDSIAIEWEFQPLSDDGLAIMFFSADGQGGKDLFDPSLEKRDGQYKKYHSGDINAFHVSYYRHSTEDESGFRVCNLRKSAGFNMVAQGADPLPPVSAVRSPYKITVIKDKEIVRFTITDPKTGIELTPFEYVDDGKTYGDFLTGGYIGFRQKAPLIGEYANLKVYSVERVTE